MKKNEESCPTYGDVYEGVKGASQGVGIYKRIPHLCGQDL